MKAGVVQAACHCPMIIAFIFDWLREIYCRLLPACARYLRFWRNLNLCPPPRGDESQKKAKAKLKKIANEAVGDPLSRQR